MADSLDGWVLKDKGADLDGPYTSEVCNTELTLDAVHCLLSEESDGVVVIAYLEPKEADEKDRAVVFQIPIGVLMHLANAAIAGLVNK